MHWNLRICIRDYGFEFALIWMEFFGNFRLFDESRKDETCLQLHDMKQKYKETDQKFKNLS